MALKPCRECKKEVSTDAKTCPHCGVSNPTVAAKDQVAGAVGVVVILGILSVAAMWCFGGDSGSSDRQAATPLSATVRFTGTQLQVTNRDDFPWTDCRLEINPGIVRGGWSASAARIGPGETVSGGVMTFTRSGGERFNPLTHQVESASVACNTPHGRRYWNGSFR